MIYDRLNRQSLDYMHCRYAGSKLEFRGPKREFDAPHITFIGGTKTYGRFVELPFPTLTETFLDIPTVNLGYPNAGIDLFVGEEAIETACQNASLTVLQILGAQNLSNRYYSVHPRRNDRFIKASSLLETIYSDVDFTDFHFNGHMLTSLKRLSPERFEIVRRELQDAWVARMKLLIERIESPVMLLWIAGHSPDDTNLNNEGLGDRPHFIDRQMINVIRPLAQHYCEIILPAEYTNGDTKGMIFTPIEAGAAKHTMGLRAHSMIADEITPVIQSALIEKDLPLGQAFSA